MKLITLNDDWPPDATLLDVRLEEDLLRAHLPGAVNACVFEMAFLDSVNQHIAENHQPIVVYGFSKQSLEARMALGKLERAGYANLTVFEGGLAEWQEAGRPVAGNGDEPDAHHGIADGTYHLDLEESHLEWLGRNLLNKHWGTIGIASGSFLVEDGALKEGKVEIDMNDLHCTDLVVVEEAEVGAPNLHVAGELTLKEVTESIEFLAVGGITPDESPAAQAAFAIDRTRWDVVYGSGKLFQHLGGHLVNDQIELDLRLIARPVR